MLLCPGFSQILQKGIPALLSAAGWPCPMLNFSDCVLHLRYFLRPTKERWNRVKGPRVHHCFITEGLRRLIPFPDIFPLSYLVGLYEIKYVTLLAEDGYQFTK